MVDDETGAPLVDLNDAGGTDVYDPNQVARVVVPTGLIRKEYWLPNVVLKADVLISVPVLKNHFLAGVTLGMKNLIGLLPNDLYHAPGINYGKHSLSHSAIELDQHIVDLNLARRPDFVVVDGQRGMIDGPVGSQIIDPPMGIILAGSDVVAVDTVGALVMGYDPKAIPYIELGAQSGLGTADTSYIRVVGVPLTQVRRDFPAPYADSPVRRAEMQPPSATIHVPQEGAWTGATTITVDASDNDVVARVELYLDNQLAGHALTPPYQFRLDSSQYPSGSHTLRAVAYDRCLNQAESSQQVLFAAPTATEPATLPPTDTSTPIPSTATATPSPTHTDTPLPTQPALSPTATLVPTAVPTPGSPPGVPLATVTPTQTSPPVAVLLPTKPPPETTWTPEAKALTPTITSAGRGQRSFSERLVWLPCAFVLLIAGIIVILLCTAPKGRKGQK